MDDLEIIKAIQEAYERKYPDWTNIKVTDMAPGPGGGTFAVVAALAELDDDEDEDPEELEEVCYISQTGKVRIFDGSGDMIHNIAGSTPWHHRMFNASTVGALAFLITLIAVITAVFTGISGGKGMDALYGILALAAGFYFGNQAKR